MFSFHLIKAMKILTNNNSNKLCYSRSVGRNSMRVLVSEDQLSFENLAEISLMGGGCSGLVIVLGNGNHNNASCKRLKNDKSLESNSVFKNTMGLDKHFDNFAV